MIPKIRITNCNNKLSMKTMTSFAGTQSWTKDWRQIHEIKQNMFFKWNVSQLIFCDFLLKNFKIWL